MIAIDGNHFLLAAWKGLIKTTKDNLVKSYKKAKGAASLCHIADSIYLVGLYWGYLIVWNEKTD
jgi:hypothetical protein